MIRLTVKKGQQNHQHRGHVLDDQQRFAKMIIFASLLHLALFLSFDISYQVPMKNILNSIVEVTLLAPEIASIDEPPSSLQPQETATTEGLSFDSTAKTKPTPVVRKRTISAASHEKRDAPYLDRWQAYVEHYGNTHYPTIALKHGLKGDLRLLVALNKDGTIHEVSVRSSSGSAQLDQAAIDLVYQAAPFEPLPKEITTDTEILEIIRTWQFRGELVTS